MEASFRHFHPSQWTLDHVLRWRAASTPDAPFLSFRGAEAESFAQIHSAAWTMAYGLASSGVTPGDRVMLLAGNSIDAINAWFAVNLIGATDVPINPALKGKPLEHAITLIDTATVIVERRLLPMLGEVASHLAPGARIFWFGDGDPPGDRIGSAPVARLADLPKPPAGWQASSLAPSDLSSILFTSGTTGPAKGVMVTQAQAFLTARQTAEGLRVGQDDVVYCAHPLFHMSPRYCAIYAALLTGAKVCLDERFSAPDWIDRIRDTGATVTIGHGPLLEMIYRQPERPDDAQTRLTRIGTSPFPRHIAVEFERRFGVKGIETWGMTEINIPCWHPFDEPLRPGSCGKIRSEWYDFRVVDPETDDEMLPGQIGEFVVRPKLPWILSPGYLRNPEATLKTWRNLWFHSGDSGYIDGDGWVYFVDRLGDRIRRRAENISSYDIEIAANGHPAILESAAIGVPSEFASDDDVKLCVVLRSGVTFDERDLLVFLARTLPYYMLPRYIERLDALPRTPTQKVGKGQLRSAGVTAGTWDRKQHNVDLRALVDSPPTS